MLRKVDSKAIFIGGGFTPYMEAFAAQGIGAMAVRSPEAAIKKIDQTSVLILHRDTHKECGDLLKLARSVPKIIFSTETSKRSIGPWLKEPLTHPVHEPSPSELLRYAQRIVREATLVVHEEKSRHESSLLRDELAFIRRMNHLLITSVDVDEILFTIMRRVKTLTNASSWAVLLADENTGQLQCRRPARKTGRTTCPATLSPGEGVAGHIALKKAPLLVADTKLDKRVETMGKGPCKCKAKSIIGVPIISGGMVLGVLEALDKKSGTFTEEDLNVLTQMADQSALAVDRIRLQQKLEELVVTDDLTSLFNTRYLKRSVETEVQRSRRYNTSTSVIFMDIDHFKAVNDTHGHLVGSKVLVEMGQILIRELRNIDIVSRYGGDEFVLVLPQTTLNHAIIIAERIRKTVEENFFLKTEGLNLRLTSSFGVASYPETATSKEQLMRLADESMYTVKNRTRNGVYAII